MTFKPTPLSEIAAHLGATVEGNADTLIRRVAPLDQAGRGDLSFLANPKYASLLASTGASAVLVDAKAVGAGAEVALVRVSHPYLAYAQAVSFLWEVPVPQPGVHSGATVHPNARVHASATIMPLAYVGADSEIGPGSILHPGAIVLERCRVGEGCVLYPGAVVREDCELGNRVILHNNASIGADGYGFAQTAGVGVDAGGAVHVKIPQVGNVVIEDDVEVGACTCIDRAAMGSTRIGRGTKIDDLVMIGHGCQIGAHTIIVAQSGMAGSATIGARSVLGARAGILGHLSIGPGTTVFSRSHVTKSTPPGSLVSGNPARPHREQLRQEALLHRLDSLFRRVELIEKRDQIGRVPSDRSGRVKKAAKPKPRTRTARRK